MNDPETSKLSHHFALHAIFVFFLFLSRKDVSPAINIYIFFCFCLLFQLLNKRIETFINSYKNSTISYPDTKPYVDGELDKLQRRWNDFKNNSDNLKRSMTLSQQYFNLLESVSDTK